MNEVLPVGFEARPATTDDFDQMALVKMRAYAGESKESLPVAVPKDYEYIEELRHRTGYQDQWAHLILNKERVAGFVYGYAGNWRGNVEPETSEQYLWLLMVDPDYQGNGFGRGLLRMASQTTRDLGADKLSLYVPTKHERAQSLYEAEGFEIHGFITSDTDGDLINYKLEL